MHELFVRTITGIILIGIGLFAYIMPSTVLSLVACAVIGYAIIYELPTLLSVHDVKFYMITSAYLLIPLICLISLNQNPLYRHLLLILFACIIAHDGGAYAVGKPFGRHLLAPTVSPKKTWEGLFGGYVATVVMIYVLNYTSNKPMTPLLFSLLFALAITLLATAGDLFESYLKRHAGVKDSGTLLPGHGGILDRFDSTLTVLPFFYICKEILIQYF